MNKKFDFNYIFSQADYIVLEDNNLDFSLYDLKDNICKTQQLLINNAVISCVIYNKSSKDFIVNFFACLLLDIDIILPANNTIEFISNLSEKHFIGDFNDNSLNIIQENYSKKTNSQLINKQINKSSKSNIYIFTSGSSGKPKKIKKSWQSFCAEIICLNKLLNLESYNNINFISSVVHHHIYGLIFNILLPFFTNNKIITKLIKYEESLLDLPSNKDYLFISSPAFLKRITLKINSNILTTTSSGGVLSDINTKNSIEYLNTNIIQILGSSETGGIAYKKQNKLNFDYSWKTLEKVNIDIINNNLLVDSPFCSFENFQQTGDLAEFTKDGFILNGRADNLVKLEEKRVSLTEVENKLIKHQYIKKVRVILVEGNRQYLACIIVLSNDNCMDISDSELNKIFRRHLQESFEKILLPRKFKYLKEMPVNEQGKTTISNLTKLFIKPL